MATLIWQRDVADVKSTFTSWDKCMAKTYCKWPVIAAIIIVSLILFSVLFCLARCICCGAECACCCFRCCAGCCGSGRKGHKKMASASAPPPMPGYQPAFQGTPVNSQYRSHTSPAFEKPQYATFETPSKPINEDALPPMPSWSDATSRKVEEEVVPEKPGDVELNNLEHHHGSAAEPMLAGAAAAPLRSPARSPVQRSPTHSEPAYAPPYQPSGFAARPPQRGPQSPDSFRSGQQIGAVDQYGNTQPGYGNRLNSPPPVSPAHEGSGFYGQNQPFGRNSPRPGGQGQEFGRNSPRPIAQNQEYGRGSPVLGAQNREYGRSSPRPVVGGMANYNNGRSTPQARPYGPPSPAPGRVNSPLAPYQAYEPPHAVPFQDVRNNYTAPEPYAELDTGYTAPKPYAELDSGYGAPSTVSSQSHGYAPSGSTRFEAASPYQNSYQSPQELDTGNWGAQHQQYRQHQQYNQPGSRNLNSAPWKDV